MSGNRLLVDPTAALFQGELAGLPPLLLDETEVEVQLVPPLARVLIARRFSNSSHECIEAVLTLPPIAPDEILYRLVVSLDGVDYSALPKSSSSARLAHDTAVAMGRCAILYELLEQRIPMISIAGIKPGVRVEVLGWSMRALARPEINRATLLIPLSATAHDDRFRLSDVDAVVTTRERHVATLTVDSEALQVSLLGQPGQDKRPLCREAVSIECSTPIMLEIVPLEGGSLDHSEWQVAMPGGWEVTSNRGVETFRHPANPDGKIVSDRTDWIFGVIATATGQIRVTAPLQSDGIAPSPHGLRDLAPNAWGMRAVAAAGLVESATAQEPDAVRLIANVLSATTSLAFIGPGGEAAAEVSVLRKLALPELGPPDVLGVAVPPVAEPPPIFEPEPARPELLPQKDDHISPGAPKSPQHWLTWTPLLLLLGVFVGSFMSIHVPFLPFISLFSGLMLMSAWRFVPSEGSPARRRLPLLMLLPLPWIASLLTGPLLRQQLTGKLPDTEGWMIPFQIFLLIAALLLPCLLMVLMPGARRFGMVLGLLNLVLTFFLTSAAVVTLVPGT